MSIDPVNEFTDESTPVDNPEPEEAVFRATTAPVEPADEAVFVPSDGSEQEAPETTPLPNVDDSTDAGVSVPSAVTVDAELTVSDPVENADADIAPPVAEDWQNNV